jgi:hypothetical protein
MLSTNWAKSCPVDFLAVGQQLLEEGLVLGLRDRDLRRDVLEELLETLPVELGQPEEPGDDEGHVFVEQFGELEHEQLELVLVGVLNGEVEEVDDQHALEFEQPREELAGDFDLEDVLVSSAYLEVVELQVLREVRVAPDEFVGVFLLRDEIVDLVDRFLRLGQGQDSGGFEVLEFDRVVDEVRIFGLGFFFRFVFFCRLAFGRADGEGRVRRGEG